MLEILLGIWLKLRQMSSIALDVEILQKVIYVIFAKIGKATLFVFGHIIIRYFLFSLFAFLENYLAKKSSTTSPR